MQHEFYEKFSDMAKNFHGPIADIAKLNLETLQKFSYIKPDEMLNTKNPEELISQQIEKSFDNMHNVIDYWQNLLLISEQTARNYFDHAQNIVKESQVDKKNVNKGKQK